MPPAPSVTPNVTQYAGPVTEMLANSDNLSITQGIMARYDQNDWCEEAATYIAVFPAGALLGYKPTTSGAPAWAHAFDADVASSGAPDLSTDMALYTWTSGALAGRHDQITIPASNDAMAVVLAEDVDIEEYTATDDGNLIVSVIWSGNFRPTGIIQDLESYDNDPFPVNVGGCDRLAIVPHATNTLV